MGMGELKLVKNLEHKNPIAPLLKDKPLRASKDCTAGAGCLNLKTRIFRRSSGGYLGHLDRGPLDGSQIKALSRFPVHHIPERLHIVGATVLVVQIIRMLPNIQSQHRLAFDPSERLAHERRILICR